jgi:hypothetical protein
MSLRGRRDAEQNRIRDRKAVMDGQKLRGTRSRLTIGEDGTVYLMNENDPPIEDDWGSAEPLTAAEVLRGARRILSDDLLADAIVIERRERA